MKKSWNSESHLPHIICFTRFSFLLPCSVSENAGRWRKVMGRPEPPYTDLLKSLSCWEELSIYQLLKKKKSCDFCLL